MYMFQTFKQKLSIDSYKLTGFNYKFLQQIIYTSDRARTKKHTHVELVQKTINKVLKTLCVCQISVSYTHLDVYKRQVSALVNA